MMLINIIYYNYSPTALFCQVFFYLSGILYEEFSINVCFLYFYVCLTYLLCIDFVIKLKMNVKGRIISIQTK